MGYFKFLNEIITLSSFYLEDNTYTMNLNIPKNVSKENINVDIDDEMRTISISYEYNDDYGSSSYQHTETVPEDANLDTIDVLFDSNKLNITIKKA
jgi:HSP20 family molecular chaperone IbpA